MFKNMMMFAEEPAAPEADPAPAPADPTPPADPAPADPAPEADPAPAEDTPPVDPNKARIDALQNSLDAALEELGKDPEPAPAPTPAPAADPAPDPAPAAPVEEPKGDNAWQKEIDSIKARQDQFESTTVKELETMKLKDEMIGLTSEIQAAIVQYPDADMDQILYQIESGSDKPVAQIAQELHNGHQALVDKIKAEQEEKIKTALGRENEGKVKVPQSSGTSSAPTDTPAPAGPGYTKATQDAAWAEATKAAKANIQ